jgi:hypothetical protein
MNKYIKYLHYVLKHKWFVFRACVEQGIIWRGLFHDMSKFYPDEFLPYADLFYGKKVPIRDKTGYYDPYSTNDVAFKHAWLNHLHRNRHHWQYWAIFRPETNTLELYEIPEKYLIEMLCDWMGAGRAQKSKLNTLEWYNAHKDAIKLHPKTAEKIEKKLEEIFK